MFRSRWTSFLCLIFLLCVANLENVGTCWGKSLGEQPSFAALAQQGDLEYTNKNYEAALIYYQKAYQIDPNALILLYNMAQAHRRLLLNLSDVNNESTLAHLQQAETLYVAFLEKTKDIDPVALKLPKAVLIATQQAARAYLTETRARLSQIILGRRPVAAIVPPATVRVYRRWWFWTAIGVVAAGAAVGLGVGVAASRPDLSTAIPVRPFAN